MSDRINEQKSAPHSKAANLKKAKAGALDCVFLPAWLLGGVILIVTSLTVISGWKIVNLESEKAQVQSERRLLERDKRVYASIKNELC